MFLSKRLDRRQTDPIDVGITINYIYMHLCISQTKNRLRQQFYVPSIYDN